VTPRKQFPLRIDPALWVEIERIAAAELRSVNAQVEFMLREAVRGRGRAAGSGAVAPSLRDGGSPFA
jgi:hypothetical protein